MPVDANSASPEFWARYHAFRRARHLERRPEDPIVPDEAEEARMKRPHEFEIQYRYELARDGHMLSSFFCSTAKPGVPGYATNRHLMGADWEVAREHRRRRIGASWLPLVLELMERHGCTTLTLDTYEESGRAFLEWLGAEKKFDDRESRLQLGEVDWEMVARWIEEGAARNPDTRLEIYDGRIPQAMWEDYTKQLSRVLNTVPMENLDHGEVVITPAMMAEWYDGSEAAGDTVHLVLTREPDGSISALTDVKWPAHTPDVVWQQFTGVTPEARGRGLGKWIKAAMLEHVHRLHPEALWVSTNNAGSNAAMLGINTALGFRLHRWGAAYQISRDDLARKISR
ncbi:MAG TPA: hypothetical protein VFO75_01115 [Candidatus Dormibacteraeota bacterium]|nr:hypothetical protein [Candidatus Dormibacteraeota bacterium]